MLHAFFNMETLKPKSGESSVMDSMYSFTSYTFQ